MRKISLILLILIVILGSYVVLFPVRHQSTIKSPLERGQVRILFTSWGKKGSFRGIVSMGIDGSKRTKIFTTKENAVAYDPALSPDGKYIAFAMLTATNARKTDIYIQAVDGTELLQITRNPDDKIASFPRWLPNGAGLLFSNAERNPQVGRIISPQIFLYDLKRKKMKNIGKGIRPLRSPDGKLILFFDMQSGLSVMNIDGSKRKVLASQKEEPTSFLPGDWSPDGKQVVYVQRMKNQQSIFLAKIEKSKLNEPRLIWQAKHKQAIFGVEWPQNDRIIFTLTTGTTLGIVDDPTIYTLSIDKSKLQRISPKDVFDLTADGIVTTFLIQSHMGLSGG